MKPLKQGWDNRGSPVDIRAYIAGGTSEDDVVHAARLPTFSESLSQEESERLMSFLTVPYMRIPMVMNFFAKDRANILFRKELRTSTGRMRVCVIVVLMCIGSLFVHVFSTNE